MDAEPAARGAEPRRVEDALRQEPTAFGFFQAVRLLERLHPERAGVGRFVDPGEEVVRFSVNPAIAFPPSEIHALAMPGEEGEELGRMSVNFMGLTGPQGVLPHHYSLLVTERRRQRDGALGAFLDLFHHRILSLFYRAWEKHRFTIAHEKQQDDRLTDHLLDFVGMGPSEVEDRPPISDQVFAFYPGLFAQQPRGAVALEQLLEDYFGVAVEVEQFVGGWYPLPRRDQCALGEEDDPAIQLGQGAVVGDEIWDPQTRVRIRLGPLTRPQFDEFLPTGSALASLRALTRFFTHDQFDLEVQLILARDDVPGCVLGGDEPPQPLGWSTWIRTAAFSRDADDTLLRL
ncbi:MAG: type VI secretion system baseplate subunit TssG [Gemmatimonadetes bacterium]|nr:type VI secretion system baseplate subunit TssG [Gemmatimonadota bacterium]